MRVALELTVPSERAGSDGVRLVMEDVVLSAAHARLISPGGSAVKRRMAAQVVWLHATQALMARDKSSVEAIQEALFTSESCDVTLHPEGAAEARVFAGIRPRDHRAGWLKLCLHFGWSQD